MKCFIIYYNIHFLKRFHQKLFFHKKSWLFSNFYKNSHFFGFSIVYSAFLEKIPFFCFFKRNNFNLWKFYMKLRLFENTNFRQNSIHNPHHIIDLQNCKPNSRLFVIVVINFGNETRSYSFNTTVLIIRGKVHN